MSRDAVLRKIRTALGVPRHGDAGRIEAATSRIDQPTRHLMPGRVAKPKAELIALFIENMRKQAADVLEAGLSSEIPATVAAHLASFGISGRVRIGDDALLAAVPWDRAPSLAIARGRADPSDTVAISVATAGIAETGTLMLASGADNPTTLAFLPEIHVAVVCEDTIVGPFEDAFDLVRARFGRHKMPRSLNLISAPSRTGDIGGKIVLGAHGPCRLIVVIVKVAA